MPAKASKAAKRGKRTARGGRRRLVGVGDRLTRTQVARRAGIDRDTVRRYLALEGAPKPDKSMRYSYRVALEWIRAQAPRLSANSDEMRRIRESIAKMEEEDMAIDLAVKRKQFVDRKLIAPTIEEVMRLFTLDLQAKFEEELPPKYKRMTALEAQQANAAAIDWLLKRFRAGLAPIAP